MIITATGWTYPAVDALMLEEAFDLIEYWIDHPPVHVTLAGIARGFGAKVGRGPRAEKKRVGTDEEAAAMAEALRAMAAEFGRPKKV